MGYLNANPTWSGSDGQAGWSQTIEHEANRFSAFAAWAPSKKQGLSEWT